MIFFCADNIPILLGDAIVEFRPLDHIVNQVARYFGNILLGEALFREGVNPLKPDVWERSVLPGGGPSAPPPGNQ